MKKNILIEVQEAIHQMLSFGSRESNLCINMSELVYNSTFEKLLNLQYFQFMETVKNNANNKTRFCGIEVNTLHPYNEIVIFDRKQTYPGDRMIVIELNIYGCNQTKFLLEK